MDTNQQKHLSDIQMDLKSTNGSIRSQSSITSVKLRAKANAAAAIKRAEIVKNRLQIENEILSKIEAEEATLAKKKREELAKLQTLQAEGDAAIALLSLQTIENELETMDDERSVSLNPDLAKIPKANSAIRTQEFINHLPKPENDKPTPAPEHQSTTTAIDLRLNPYAQPFRPVPGYETSLPLNSLEYIARRELVSRKIDKFDDNPENFHTWKNSFKEMINSVKLSPSEEISLILEYTTNDSKRLTQRLRNAYKLHPEEAVKQVWKKLGERYGSDATISQRMIERITKFPYIKDSKWLQEFGDLLLELDCAKFDGELKGLGILDEPMFLKPIASKLPEELQRKWQSIAFKIKNSRGMNYPPFHEFAKFVQEMAELRNDPLLSIEPNVGLYSSNRPTAEGYHNYRKTPIQTTTPSRRNVYNTAKTSVQNIGLGKDGDAKPTPIEDNRPNPRNWCILHDKPHPLKKCRTFLSQKYDEKKRLLSQHYICFKCMESCDHLARECTSTVSCVTCKSNEHDTILHSEKYKEVQPLKTHGEEPRAFARSTGIVNKCVDVCESNIEAKSCAKICLANVYEKDNPTVKIKAYIVIDEQSNRSLARTELFESLNIGGIKVPYTLKTCSGVTETSGRQAENVVIESLDESVKLTLPALTECNAIPAKRDEIPTPRVARAHPHLARIADYIPELDETAQILILIGRDVSQLHKIHESINGPANAPWGQRIDLGWVVIGNACLNGAHKPGEISVYKTHVLHNGRPSVLVPCQNQLHVKLVSDDQHKVNSVDDIGNHVFVRTPNDNKLGTSIEDRHFLNIMDREMQKDVNGNWEAPLPIRESIGLSTLPSTSSREAALRRLKLTSKNLDRNPEKKSHYFAFMKKILDLGHAEVAPNPNVSKLRPIWYLPHFGVYHPKKNKIRVVFDSAAECKGVSLNKLLLSGPDLTNSLLGVLLRFRQNKVAIVADIEQMFHSFKVVEKHRDLLRFFWFEDNKPGGKIIEYRMKVHIFGNTSSPAVANYGLRQTAEIGETEYGADAKSFVLNHFYVDDGLNSVTNCEEAVDLIRRTEAMLATANLRLHKFASNKKEVMEAFPPEDRASDLYDMDFSKDPIPTQRSLGVSWDINTDSFTFNISVDKKPFSRRGALSITNSIYDPLGIAAPVVIKGKALLREMCQSLDNSKQKGWDVPLPEQSKPAWQEWCNSLKLLQEIKLPRCYAKQLQLQDAKRLELHIFCDASEMAIGSVAYLKSTSIVNNTETAFIMGKAKLTPSHATSMPRLELCAAVLAVEMGETIISELELSLHEIVYHTDSKVVIGYINNESRRFYAYVANRVERIRQTTKPSQWRYVPTNVNPADLATRSVKAGELTESIWFTGPKFLCESKQQDSTKDIDINVIQNDPEIRKSVRTMKTSVYKGPTNLGAHRFERFSTWFSLLGAITTIINAIDKRKSGVTHQLKNQAAAKIVIIKAVQADTYSEEISCIKDLRKLPSSNPLSKLNPVLDEHEIMRVGGRLGNANLEYDERHPIILPASHHISTLIVNMCHESIRHQGRVFTQGAIRKHGFWITGGKRLLNRIINRCVHCRRSRGAQQSQEMANLPLDRVNPAPPFSYVGLDVFGPWEICSRRTRGGLAHSKRWAVLFTCMTIRAVHIEVIENMDASSFINALRRFIALRGPVVQIRSDCGTNFTGAVNELKGKLTTPVISATQKYLLREECEWIFNPPHSSHFGGAWERMIGISRKILDNMLKDIPRKHLTHEVLTTLLAEVTAIINDRPLIPVSCDPDAPEVLSPNVLLNQKLSQVKAPYCELSTKDLYNKQWKRVQHYADMFWTRWKREFLPTLQPRTKWRQPSRNIKIGDIVLVRNAEIHRNQWPLGRVIEASEDDDGKVRKVTLEIFKDNTKKQLKRPITELVLLLESEDT